jgi:hypothetical protein
MSDQPVARPLPNINTDIHALSGIRAHDPSVRTSEDSSCLRPRGQCDRHVLQYLLYVKSRTRSSKLPYGCVSINMRISRSPVLTIPGLKYYYYYNQKAEYISFPLTGRLNKIHPLITTETAWFILQNICLLSSHTNIITTECRFHLHCVTVTLTVYSCVLWNIPAPLHSCRGKCPANHANSAERISYCYCFIILIIREGYKTKYLLVPVILIIRITAQSTICSVQVFHSFAHYFPYPLCIGRN